MSRKLCAGIWRSWQKISMYVDIIGLCSFMLIMMELVTLFSHKWQTYRSRWISSCMPPTLNNFGSRHGYDYQCMQHSPLLLCKCTFTYHATLFFIIDLLVPRDKYKKVMDWCVVVRLCCIRGSFFLFTPKISKHWSAQSDCIQGNVSLSLSAHSKDSAATIIIMQLLVQSLWYSKYEDILLFSLPVSFLYPSYLSPRLNIHVIY